MHVILYAIMCCHHGPCAHGGEGNGGITLTAKRTFWRSGVCNAQSTPNTHSLARPPVGLTQGALFVIASSTKPGKGIQKAKSVMREIHTMWRPQLCMCSARLCWCVLQQEAVRTHACRQYHADLHGAPREVRHSLPSAPTVCWSGFQSDLRCLLPPCHTGCLLRSQSAPGVCSKGPAVTSCPNRRAKSSALVRTANNAAGGADETLKEEQTACIVQAGACTRGMACECAGAGSAAPGPLTPLPPPTPAQPNLAMRRVPASEKPQKST